MSGPPIRDVASSKHTKLGIYGASGIGKTRFVASSIEMGPTLILRSPLDQTESIYGSGVKEWVVQDWGEMTGDVLDYLRAEGNKWAWVWLDSLSLWDEMGLMDVWEAAIDRKKSRREFGLDKQEYGINQTRLTEWLTHVIGLDTFNFGWTALPMLVTDPETNDDIWMPMVQGREGKMTHKACGYMNVVGYLAGKKVRDTYRRTLYLQQDGEHYAKDQYTCTEKGRLIEPTVPKLMAAIDAARKRMGSTPPKPARAKAAIRPTTKRPGRTAARRTTRKRES